MPMKLLSHRGYWKKPEEKNQKVAFERSLSLGFGIETDLRDRNEELVIAHDMPDANSMPFNELLDLVGERPLTLALNIKADGLAKAVAAAMAGSQCDWFVFDMSVPDMLQHLNAGNPVFARMSEVELCPPWIDEVRGVWLDAFSGVWYGPDLVRSLLDRGLEVCVVSPELHGHDFKVLWNMLLPLRDLPNLMLCTDFPEEANTFFNTRPELNHD